MPTQPPPAHSPLDVLGIGAAAVDDLLYVDGHPEPDTKMRVQESRREAGGLIATALVTVARLGGTAAWLGVLGDDDLSRFTVAELDRERVDVSRVLRRRGARPFHSVILVDRRTGHRTLLYNDEGVQAPAASDVPDALIRAARVLLVDSTVAHVALHAVARAREAGVPVVADIEAPVDGAVGQLALVVDHLVVGLAAGANLTGLQEPREIARALWRPGRAAAVVTAGHRGSWYVARETGGQPIHQPALPVRAIDTTGCGDVFHGAYAAAIARGEGVAEAVSAATVAAGMKATVRGGRSGIPDQPSLDRQLRDLPKPSKSGPGADSLHMELDPAATVTTDPHNA